MRNKRDPNRKSRWGVIWGAIVVVCVAVAGVAGFGDSVISITQSFDREAVTRVDVTPHNLDIAADETKSVEVSVSRRGADLEDARVDVIGQQCTTGLSLKAPSSTVLSCPVDGSQLGAETSGVARVSEADAITDSPPFEVAIRPAVCPDLNEVVTELLPAASFRDRWNAAVAQEVTESCTPPTGDWAIDSLEDTASVGAASSISGELAAKGEIRDLSVFVAKADRDSDDAVRHALIAVFASDDGEATRLAKEFDRPCTAGSTYSLQRAEGSDGTYYDVNRCDGGD